MTTNQPVPSRRKLWHRILFWILAVVGLSAVVVAAVAINTVTLNRDARLMRNEIVAAIDSPTRTQIQLTIGPAVVACVRVGLAFCDHVPPEARLALKAVNAASVGVYKLSSRSRPGEFPGAKLFAMSDRLMNRRGWMRVVGVNHEDESVLIYMPSNTRDHGLQRVCVAVCKRDQLVIVSASGTTDSLVELATAGRALAKL